MQGKAVGVFATWAALVACDGISFNGSRGTDAGATGGAAGHGASGAGAPAGGARVGEGGGAGSGGTTRSTGGAASGGRESRGAGGVIASGGVANAGGVAHAGGGGAPATGGSPAGGGSSGGTPSMGGATGSGGNGVAGSAGQCTATSCRGAADSCCGGECVSTIDDPRHCGACGNACSGATPTCLYGKCAQPACFRSADAGVCAPGSLCCGQSCCAPGQICCAVPVILTMYSCHDPAEVGATCPVGCPDCVCASPDTLVATPAGDRAIASLREGELVLSVDHGRVVAVPISEAHRTPARNHRVVRVELDNGSVLEISAPHPTADGRTFGDLRKSDELGGVRIRRVAIVEYAHPFTYDILPASDSGTYFAGGVLIGSTLGGDAMSSTGRDYARMTLGR